MKEYYACGDDCMFAGNLVKPLTSGTSVRMHQMKEVSVPRRSTVDAISGALTMERELVDELIENEDLYEPEEF